MTMYEGPLRRSTDRHSSSSGPWWKKLWRGFVNHLTNTKTPMGLVYLGALIIGFGFRAVLVQQSALDSAQRSADLRQTQQELFNRDVQAWVKASGDYTLCLDSVSRSDLNRQQWQDIAEGLDSIGANQFAERVRNGPVLSSKPREPEDCVEPGPAPVAPDEDSPYFGD